MAQCLFTTFWCLILSAEIPSQASVRPLLRCAQQPTSGLRTPDDIQNRLSHKNTVSNLQEIQTQKLTLRRFIAWATKCVKKIINLTHIKSLQIPTDRWALKRQLPVSSRSRARCSQTRPIPSTVVGTTETKNTSCRCAFDSGRRS